MKSLRWRFFLPYLGVLTAVLIGLSLYLPATLRSFVTDQWRSNLLSEARLVALQSSESLRLATPPGELAEFLKQQSQLLDARVTLIRADGVVIADSAADPAEMENHADRPEVRAALSGTESTQMRGSSTLGGEMLYAAVPVRSGGQVIGCARLAVDASAVAANIAIIQRRLVTFTLAVILAAAALTLLLTEYTIRPLHRLTGAARQMSAGSFPQLEARRGSRDEIAILEHTFNEMSAQIQGKVEELEAERAKLDSVLANMTDGVLIVDPDNRVSLINPAAAGILNIETEHVHGRTLIEVGRQYQLVDLLQRTRRDGKTNTVTLEANQGRAFIQAIASPLSQQAASSVLILLQDFTRLRRLETVRRDFVSNVSHELRTPLAALKSLVETLQEGAIDDPPAAQRFLQRMDYEIDNLIQLVQELLELAKIESGRVPLEKETVSPHELIRKAVERMQLQAERAGLTLNIDVPADLPDVLADRARMEQVVVNLVHNAIKFTPPGGMIRVNARREAATVTFSVSDTGAGIAPADLNRIFERFYKTDPARSGGGTGLGLSIARHLVEAHGGRIWAESQLKTGSTFFFTLPLSAGLKDALTKS